MPLIIAATDFSETGENAVNYACQLAVAQKAELSIVHSYVIPVMFSDIPVPSPIINDTKNDAEAQMNELVSSCKRTYPQLAVHGQVVYGDIIQTLEEYTEQAKKPWLIVVGNSFAGEDVSWMDSILKNSFKRLKVPVLAVPPGIRYQQVHKLCFAFDNKHPDNDIALRQLSDLTVRLSADLHVLNIQDEDKGDTHEIDETAKALLSAAKPEYHVIFQKDNVEPTIIKFIEDTNIDWLVVIPRKHSFFEGLFHKSITNAISHHVMLPIVALHDYHS